MSIDDSIRRKTSKEPTEEARLRARMQMDAVREAIHKRIGTVELAVSSIREFRDD